MMLKNCSSQFGSMVRPSACGLKGYGFNSGLGNVPPGQAQCLAPRGAHIGDKHCCNQVTSHQSKFFGQVSEQKPLTIQNHGSAYVVARICR